MMKSTIGYKEVLNFWFNESDSSLWFAKDDKFDQEIRKRFGQLHSKAIKGELWEWRQSIHGRLAEIIILDQFSRNLFRNQAEAFAYDRMSLVLAQEALKDEELESLSINEKAFLFMPFMHSESLEIQKISLELFNEEGLEENYKFAVAHKEIIEKFGRYPHRNEALNRKSTKEEKEYLKINNGF